MILPAGPEHAAGIASVYAPYVRGTAISFEEVPPTADDIAARLAQGLPWLVALDQDEVVGFCSASRHRTRAGYRWAVDCSVYLAPSAQGKGLGRALYTELFEELRQRGFVHAFAGIALPNPASVGLHEAMGFELVGVYRSVGFKLGRWHDVGWWQLQLREPPERPDEPLG